MCDEVQKYISPFNIKLGSILIEGFHLSWLNSQTKEMNNLRATERNKRGQAKTNTERKEEDSNKTRQPSMLNKWTVNIKSLFPIHSFQF